MTLRDPANLSENLKMSNTKKNCLARKNTGPEKGSSEVSKYFFIKSVIILGNNKERGNEL